MQKHDAVHLRIEPSGRDKYSNLEAAIQRVQRGVNEALGCGAHFVLKETEGFYAGRGARATAPAEQLYGEGSEGESESESEGESGSGNEGEHGNESERESEIGSGEESDGQ